MTAFNLVLSAEQEAEQAINTAKEEAAAATVAARTEHRTRIEAEKMKLEEVEKSALTAHQAQVDEMTKKIMTDVEAQVVAIEKRFVSHKVELKSVIKQSFQ